MSDHIIVTEGIITHEVLITKDIITKPKFDQHHKFLPKKGITKMTEQYAKTQKFSLNDDKNQEMHAIVSAVYQALREKGYDPINQLVGYILSEDPTYITNHKSARALICRIDRDELMRELVKNYLGI